MNDEAYPDAVLEIECPYKNCGAGPGMKCLVHKKGDAAPELRDTPHAVRYRHADTDGPTEEERDLLSELEDEIAAM